MFSVKPGGLDAVGWAICVVVGMGSVVVGYLVRILPPMPIPEFLYADYKPNENLDKVRNITSEICPDKDMESPANELWKKALSTTRLQVGGI